jgi:enamine deaminase RidA (YjgF/YER057c/UK114 family)
VEIRRINPGPRMSKGVVHGNLLFSAGQVDTTGANVTEQTKNILASIDALLAQSGSDRSKLISANIWLADIATFNEMNAVWDAWIDKDNPPARATVEARLANPDYKVEIAIVAAI